MATVYLARDLRHDRFVALKVMRPDLASSVGAERFLHEIRITAQLRHPHILPVFDSGEAGSGDTGGHLWYTMPYVEGETLRQRLVRAAYPPDRGGDPRSPARSRPRSTTPTGAASCIAT